ncbi:hypothetical protein PFICI_01141 [Pestalotiopsis fici W106-1]|uniref:Uncharacterized protein n=1 Tax=Pestalotiopsis fici (strain W106-1 / CGMCC3.15140) TaxID=1229662 RepID=W3XMP4_PESFW|nr:uncharacterized protein PFICI_01141 [Pestalotiopsis fici W106-1]ETS87313.1 hypothetical protein PFICI_01141 [Pestalotiopsis fici W106-1]
MRLLQCDDTGRFTLTPDLASDHGLPYAILSHTWGPDEVIFTDITGTQIDWQQKSGFDKIKFCAEQARRDGLQYFWVDTCCIDKSDSIELQTAINSMFRWYRDAKRCYVYLADVSVPSISGAEQSTLQWEAAFRTSRWYTRGWTLQELLAPERVDFFSKEGARLGDKRSLEQEIHDITKIPIPALRRAVPFDQFNVDERMKWAESRRTTHEEDLAYCLLGIFGVFMPLNYGEGRNNAFIRLKKEIGDNPERQEWLQKLYVCPYQERKDRNPPRVESTCKWFTDHSLFQKWQMSSTAQLLWVSADPGCGKSVLAKYLIDDVLASTILRTTCFFFFKDDYEDQRSSTTAMCSLLHQIFHHHPIAFSTEVLEKFKEKGSALLQSFSDLWDILISATSGHKREFIFIFDALDECETSGQIQLINAISEFSSRATTRSPVLKFLLLSRPYIDIARRFLHLNHDLPTIHLAGENEEEATQISHEIDMVIRSRVAVMGRTLGLDQEKQAVLVGELVRVPNRTYLWTHLIFDEIQSSILLTPNRIRSIVRNIPRSVSEAYDKMLSKSRDIRLARKLLHIVVTASRPLTLKEMSLALAMRPHHQSITDADPVPEGQFRDDLRQLCGLFLIVVDSRIYLLHQTAREFLVLPSTRSLSPLQSTTALQWEFSFHPQKSHRILAEICVQRLSFADLNGFPLGGVMDLDDYLATRTLSEYAVRHWANHFGKTKWEDDYQTVEKVILYCHPDSPGSAWCSIYPRITRVDAPYDFTPLLLASYFGLSSVLERLSKKAFKYINFRDEDYGRSAISWAAMNGHDAIVERLLDRSLAQRLLGRRACLNTKDHYGNTPLALACRNGHELVVQHLLKASAHINTENLSRETPLYMACGRGYNTIVQQLLQAGADIDIRNRWEETPLGRACGRGYDTIVKQLLQAGADIDIRNQWGETPLGRACERGYDRVVQQLLQAGADVNMKHWNEDMPENSSGWDWRLHRTPLEIAEGRGHTTIVQQLLQAGADVSTRDE